MTHVAFQGIAGAYSEQVIRQYFGIEVEAVPCETFNEVFRSVEASECDYGMLPVENSVADFVNRSYELLVEHDLRIYAEIILRVRYMLLAPPGTTPASIKIVRSHPQALAQCQRYLARYDLKTEATPDTAGAAHALAANPELGVAVIARAVAADLAGLEIIDRHIEDSQLNYTRFFILSCEDAPRTQRNKPSVVFTTPYQPGALYECLAESAVRRVRLSKIESRPRANRPWQYMFYLDFEGHCRDPECEAAMMGLLRRSSFVKMLGSYPAATTLVDDSQGSLNQATEPEVFA